MGYRDRLNGSDTIDLGDGYVVSVKHMLSRAEIRKAEGFMTNNRQTMRPDKDSGEIAGIESTLNMGAFNEHRVLQSIISWNMEGECGVVYKTGNRPCQAHPNDVWPIDIEHVGALVEADYQTVLKHVQANNRGRSKEEQATFRPGGERSGDDGHSDNGSDVGAVLHSAGVLETVRPD